MLLPTFEAGADHALEVAAQAAALGIDGVFAYDHLWPMGSPERPSLAPFALLASVARAHEGLWVGPLVARVGLVGTAHLVEQFLTLEALAPGRVIGALGTGDKLSVAENDAYGLARRSPDERRAMMAETARWLMGVMPVWFGAGAPATNVLARSLGVTVNMWNATPQELATAAAAGPVSWAGPAPADLGATLDALAEAGASWSVLSPQVNIDDLAKWRRGNELSKFR